MMSRDVSIGGINAATGDESAASGVERKKMSDSEAVRLRQLTKSED